MAWVDTQGVWLEYIQLVNSQHNTYVERYNRAVRNEWRGQYIFKTLEAAQSQATEWLWTYNNERPNRGISGITP